MICLFVCTACDTPAAETGTGDRSTSYAVHYTISPDIESESVVVEMLLRQTNSQLRELSFSIDGERTTGIDADGELLIEENTVRWRPGKTGGRLQWRTEVTHRRNGKGYDAWLSRDWGIFRCEDIIPRAWTRTLVGASSNTSVSFKLPVGWSAITEYPVSHDRIDVRIPARRFDQPRGWIAMGSLGVRRESIAGVQVAVAAPQGQSVRRLDMLALLNWTIPELVSIMPDTLPRLTIVSAGDPMWRGGLSAPGSIFLHADRPLISENGTSTLVHEAMHVAMGISAAPGFDWIVEGLAEYYSLELLRRGGAITSQRHRRAVQKQADWAATSEALCAVRSSGAATAMAVGVFRHLDEEIRRKSGGRFSLDDVVAKISGNHDRVHLRSLQDIVGELLQESADALRIKHLPGCDDYWPTPKV